MKTDWEAVFQLYLQVSDLAPAARARCLERAYSEGPQLREPTERLLAADRKGGNFLETPPATLAADLLDSRQEQFAPGQRVGEYQIVSLVSIGGMGEVYRAEQHSSGKTLALKVIRPHVVAQVFIAERFAREARAGAAVRHGNVVAIHELFHFAGSMFIVMEWVEGQTWRAMMNAGSIEVARAIELARQAACGLAAIHEAGIAHRDIKPENLMLSKSGEVKIIDFGLARPATSALPDIESEGSSGTISGTLSGTFSYLPPELFRGEPASSATDVFSLGSVFYELFTGHHPFSGQTPLDVYEAIECRTPDLPSSVRPEIPAAIDRLLLAMLSREREARPGAADIAVMLSSASERSSSPC